MRPSPQYAWGTVSDLSRANMNDRYSVYAAFTICWMFGFANVTNPVLTTTYGGGSGDILWSSMRCTDKDTDFRLCPASYPLGYSQAYSHYYDLGVDCYPQPFETVVKLEAGGAPWKGRIMLQYTPHLPIGSVCNDLFKHNHFAWNAACRSAGFLNVTNARYQHFGPAASNVPISVDDVVCTETDLFLQNCSHRPYGQHNCFHGEDAGVDCYPPPDPIWDWQFRLADGTSATNGRIEMRPSAIMPWGSICAGPYFNHSVPAWEAACRSVGIASPPRARWRYFGKGSDTVYLDNVSCTAGNKILLNCSMFPINSYRCDASEVAGVDCDAPPEQPSQWQFRLADGRTATSGRLEMRPDTVTPWGAVCRRGLTTFEALRAVCRTAGHPTATRPQLYRTRLSSISPSLPFYLDSAVCNASTPTLNHCSYAPLFSHDCSFGLGDALYVECFPTATATLSASQTTTVDAGSRSTSQWLSRTRVASPSNGTPPRTPSRALTPTGGWPKIARTATLTVLYTPSKVEVSTTASLRQTLTLTREAPSDSLTLTRSAAPKGKTHSNSGTITTGAVTLTPHSGRRTWTSSKALTATAANTAAVLPPPSPAKTHTRTTITATPTPAVAEPRPRCDANPLERTALFDIVRGTPLLRPLVSTYVAAARRAPRGGGEDEDPPTPVVSVVNFSVSLLPSAAAGYDMFFPILSVVSLTARLLDPMTLGPVSGASTVSLTVIRHAEAAAAGPLIVNGTFSVHDATLLAPPQPATVAGNGAVLQLAVPTTEAVIRHVRCVTAAANLTVIARLVLVDAARDTGTGGGGGGVIVALQSAAVSSSDSYGGPCMITNSGTALSSSPSTSLRTSMAFFRMLSPFSTGPGYAMVLAGSASATGVVLVLQLLTVVWMRARGKATSLLGCAAAARAPALTIAVAEPLWFGVAYAGASLVVVGSSSSAHATATPTQVVELIAGAAVCVATVAVPVIVALCLRRYVSRRLVAYQCVRPNAIPACLAPHLVPTTRVKPEALVKVLAPLVSFRSLHPLFPALGSVSPVVTVFVVLVTGLVPGVCRWTHAALAVAHLLLAVLVAAARPRRTTILNTFTAAQFLCIAAAFGWAARMASAAAATDEAEEKAVLTALVTLQTAVVGVRIALVPLAFFSDRLLPYSGVRVVAEVIAGSANGGKGEETLHFAFRPGHPDYVHDDEDPEIQRRRQRRIGRANNKPPSPQRMLL